jgi:hypothetical protein
MLLISEFDLFDDALFLDIKLCKDTCEKFSHDISGAQVW